MPQTPRWQVVRQPNRMNLVKVAATIAGFSAMFQAIAIALAWLGLMQVAPPKAVTEKAAAQSTAKAAAEPAKSPAKAAVNDDLAREVRRLVRQLDDASVAARDDAYAQLVKLGPDVLEHLPTATD